MQYSVISTRITSLYRSQPSSVVFACKTETFGPELQVSMGTRPHLSFCAWKTEWLSPELLVSMGSSPHLWFCAFKTAALGPILHVSMGPRPHPVILRLRNSMHSIRITSLYGSQTSSVILCMQYIVISTRLHESLWVPALICRFVHAKQRDFCTRITSLYGPRPHLWFYACKTAWLSIRITIVSMGPRPHLSFVHSKPHDYHQNY